MFQIDARVASFFGSELNLHFAGAGEVRFILPGGADLPGQHEASRRIPFENGCPITLGAIGLLAITAAADAPFNKGLLHWCIADVVGARPPTVELIGKDVERTFRAGANANAFADRSVVRRWNGRKSWDLLLLYFLFEGGKRGGPEPIEVGAQRIETTVIELVDAASS